MLIDFPIEFLVKGTPVSLQAKRAESRREWKERVKTASKSALPEDHFASEDRISVTLYYLPDEQMQGDVDNIVKPILDALCQHIYIDDTQVERVLVQKFEPGNIFEFSNPSATFARALEEAKPVLYVRVSNDPHEGLT
jgi:crossover junction endodeoxyribonuclease RusA